MRTKVCSKCKKEKPINEFYRNKTYKDGYAYWCKKCHKKYFGYGKYGRRHYIKRANWFKNIKKAFKCEICGTYDYRVLVFHHKNPEEKEMTIGYMIESNYSKEKILKEISKCQVLCSNCHIILHWEEHNKK